MSKTMGYCRVSSIDQNETRQILKMKVLGIEDRYIFVDKQSGKDFNRLEYQLMKRFCEEGDLVYIDSLDRLGRNYDGIITEWKYITRIVNANIVCLDNETLFDSRKFKSMGDIGKLMEDQFLSPLELDFVSVQWKNTVMVKEGGKTFLVRRHLEVCVFYYLASGLKTGDLCIDTSEEFLDYREQLLPWNECEPLISDFCAEMNFKENPGEFIEQLKTLLKEKSLEVDIHYPDNGQIISEKNEPILKRAKAKNVPKSTVDLENAIYKYLPERDVIQILCNVEHWLHWTRHFGPLSGSDPKLENAIERYITLVFGYGCNLGPTQTSRHMKNSVTPHMLSFTNRRHVTASRLDEAIKDIINLYNKCYLPKLWGNNKIVAVDGTMFDLYKENLVSEYHIRYGGNGGIAYHHISDTYIALFSHFIPCGVWEAIYIIDGLLKNKSDVQPDTIHGDTQAQSAPVFALTYLLGIKLMPRIRNWKDLKFYRFDKTHKYKHIESLFSDIVDWKLIETHWKDMLQVILSIKNGKIVPSTLLRKLNNYSHKNKLYQAFRELGRVIRTIFLLQYISDIELRQQITASTNKMEAYNGFSKFFFFGGEGVITENDPDEQEKRIKYNDLVSTSILGVQPTYV